MNDIAQQPSTLMAREIAEAPSVFARTVKRNNRQYLGEIDVDKLHAIYTIARGSSDAAANIISYLFMKHIGLPVTSMPPSTFSIYDGVRMTNSLGLIISQSGASNDLIACAKGIRNAGGQVVGITNQPASNVEAIADVTIPIDAGQELAVPATKSVIGSIAAGMSILAALKHEYCEEIENAATAMMALENYRFHEIEMLQSSFLRAHHVYVVGRGAGFGAAQEIALKLKETAAVHAEAFSASEVLHGPLQLATNPLLILIIDTCESESQASLDQAEAKFQLVGGEVFRLRPPCAENVCPAAAAAMALYLLYPAILNTALALGLDPDNPSTLAKVTKTS